MLKIFDTEEELARVLSLEMLSQLKSENNPIFCLASGSTPAKTYKKFVENAEVKQYIEKLKFVGLDEWVGIHRDVDGSCYQMLHKDLFQYLSLTDGQIEFFDAVNDDLEKECKRIDAYINENPITFSLMGVGMNGHIGLNEPGEKVKNFSSVVPLSETTKTVAQKYFENGQVLTDGITLGLQQIMNSKRVVVVITGAHKKEIVKKIFEERTTKLPVQELLGQENIDFYLDKEAFSLVKEESVKEFM